MNHMTPFESVLVTTCVIGAILCTAILIAFRIRRELELIHEQWLRIGPLGRVMSILGVSIVVLYGGTKPPASTNEPPNTTGGDTTNEPPIYVEGDLVSTNEPPNTAGGDTTNEPPIYVEGDLVSTNEPPDGASGDGPTNPPPMMCFSPRPMMSPPPADQGASPVQLTTVSNWTARGAWNDWLRISFPDGFTFPFGTNMLTGVTLMSQGALRTSLSDPTPLIELPSAVSIEPEASSVAYGPTASNSFLFAWSNACIDRDPTNRVDASIELFRNGDIALRFGGSATNFPATPPEGFVGRGQDADWAATAFSSADYAAITNKGYARWLDEDYVGYNEENGHYKATITVRSMPPNGEPCYLVCGPYKVIVKEPGEYSFPLVVFNEYTARTYPTALPLSVSYDDGYYPDEDVYGPLMMSGAPSNSNGPRLLGSSAPTILSICMIPSVHLSPAFIEFGGMVSHHISIWCNMAQVAWEYVTLGPDTARVNFYNRHEAEIVEAMVTYCTEIIISERSHPDVWAAITLIPPIWDPNYPTTNDCDNCGSDTNRTSSGTEP